MLLQTGAVQKGEVTKNLRTQATGNRVTVCSGLEAYANIPSKAPDMSTPCNLSTAADTICTAHATVSTAAATMSMVAASSQAPPCNAACPAQFEITSELIHCVDKSALQATDISMFDVVEERHTLAKGAEGNAQPPTMFEVAVSVKHASPRANGPALAAAVLADILECDDSKDDDEDLLHFKAISAVVAVRPDHDRGGPVLVPIRRPHARTGSLRIAAHEQCGQPLSWNKRGRGPTLTHGAEDAQSAFDKLSIFDILLDNSTAPTRMALYNGVLSSAIHTMYIVSCFRCAGLPYYST